MSNFQRIIFSFFLVVFSFESSADSPVGSFLSGTEINCPGVIFAESTVITCNEIAYKNADLELNAVYKKLVSSADENEKIILRDIQRAWIALKNAQCDLVEHYYSTARHTMKWTTKCNAVMTIRRVEELKQLGSGIDW